MNPANHHPCPIPLAAVMFTALVAAGMRPSTMSIAWAAESDTHPAALAQEAPPAEPAKEPDATQPTAPSQQAEPPKQAAPSNRLETVGAELLVTILGKKVVDLSGKDMGLVTEILLDREGQPRAAIIDFGGFLGVGTRKIAIDWQLLKFASVDTKAPLTLALGRDDLQGVPEYKASADKVEIVGPPHPDWPDTAAHAAD